MFNEQNTTEVRDKIIEASRELFVSKGFKGTTVRDIAAASDTNVAMVNYYFRSKYNLFEEIFNESFDLLTEKIFSIVSSNDSFFDMIRNWVDVYYGVLLENPQIPMFVMQEISQNPEALRERLGKKPYQLYVKLSERIAAEEKKGTIKDISVADLLLNVISLCLYPFMFKNVASLFLDMSESEYMEHMKSHKTYVKEFIIDAIKK